MKENAIYFGKRKLMDLVHVLAEKQDPDQSVKVSHFI